jgi:phosphoglucomutase
MDYKEKYNLWLNNEYFDEETKKELLSIKEDEEEIMDRFYKDLTFGTAGLRGKIGAGTNRMNRYTVALATQGLADTIKSRGENAIARGVAIAYDCRHFSKEFALETSLVLAGNGIKVYLFDALRPTPELSFAIRRLKTISGIVITASHNPKEYNGYKVYWEEGSQILADIASEILNNINKIEDFQNIKRIDEEEALNKGLLNIIGEDIDCEYIESIKGLSIRDDIDKDVKIVYTPLNGAGNKLVRRVLKDRGFTNIVVVPEQENPDPDFTTVGYPNPEDLKAFEYAKRLGKKVNADLLIATDPDSDRVACMVRDKNGEYEPLNGNQTGAILINYILMSRKEKNNIPKNGVIVKSIVTGDLGRVIAKDYGVDTIETLTGFKHICNKANEFDKTGEHTFLFGYEESIGYVYDTIVRDKDGVISSMLIAEAAGYYKKMDKTLLDVLNEIYKTYGYYSEKLISLVFEGIEGQKKIARMMESFRDNPIEKIGDASLIKMEDYLEGKSKDFVEGEVSTIDIPQSNVLKYFYSDGSWFAIRPSGTEPKIKIYIYTIGKDKNNSCEKIQLFENRVMNEIS